MLLNIKLLDDGGGGGVGLLFVFSGGRWGLLMRGGWVLKIKEREQ